MPSSYRFPRLRSAVAVAAAGALALALSACGGGSTTASSTTSSAASTAASSSAEASGSSAPTTSGFPVTITHAFGQTTIDSAPERVATWGWGSADAALALGVVPVAIPQQTYGGNAEGVLPWVADKLAADGAATPAILPNNGTDAPIEQILAAKPDVLLAQYSGITQLEYDRLTQGGVKVIAYPQTAWSTPWRDVVSITGQVLGKTAEAETVLKNIDAEIAQRAAANPDFAGKSMATAYYTGGVFYVYLPADPRVQFTEDLGFVTPDSVTSLDTKEATFFYTLSPEQFGSLTADVLLIYGATDDELNTFLATPEAKLLPQLNGGKIVKVTGEAEVSSVSPPTALSLTWGLDKFIDDIKAGLAA